MSRPRINPPGVKGIKISLENHEALRKVRDIMRSHGYMGATFNTALGQVLYEAGLIDPPAARLSHRKMSDLIIEEQEA